MSIAPLHQQEYLPHNRHDLHWLLRWLFSIVKCDHHWLGHKRDTRWWIRDWCKGSMNRGCWLLPCYLRIIGGSCRGSRGPSWHLFTWTETTFVATVPWLASGGLVVPLTVETKSVPLNYWPSWLTISNHITMIWWMGAFAVGALPFSRCVRLWEVSLSSMSPGEKLACDCWGGSMLGCVQWINIDTCL